jgi:hypothetical protein
VTSRYIESQKINKHIIRARHDITLQLDHGKKKKRTMYLRPKAKLHYGVQPGDLQSTSDEFSHEQIRTHVKYTDKIPRPSHNIYTKIFPLWLSESALPGALRCIDQNEIFIKHGRNKIVAAKKTSAQHNGCPEKRGSLYTTVRKRNKTGREGGHVTDHVIKEHNREDRS